jgi:predicted house-cleaning noncanonical NTP pyrophosphatase (MazG superfamily)
LVAEKLVRDLIPDIIRKNGQEPRIRVADTKEMDYLLRMKILEEASELLASGSDEEISDVLESIEALLEIRCISRDDIELVRYKKKEARGGFSQRFVLIMDEE